MEKNLRGTIVCGVVDTDAGRTALETAVDLSRRLGLRLVLAHAGPRGDPVELAGAAGGSASEERESGERLLARLAAEHGIVEPHDRRVGTGDAATVIGQIAAEEAADLIVVGSRLQGHLRRGFRSTLALQLACETPIPVVVAPPSSRRTATMAA